jgi:hypothetical protein
MHMLRTHRKQPNGEKGFVMVMYTLMMLFIIVPMVGLAIDTGILYTIKAKLQASVDGAALGSARSLNRGQDIPSQQTAATDTAKRYYHANFPANWMGVTPVNDPTVTWPAAPPATAIINVQGDVDAPTWFMRILGFNSVHLTAIGQATRRNVDIMLVVDRSSSLSFPVNECPSLISGAQLFVNSFSNNRDIVGLLTFGTYYHVDFAPVTDFQDQAGGGANSLASVVLPKLVCAGFTNGAAAYSKAYQTLKTVNGGLPDKNALNVILFFTDGQPNTITFGPDYDPNVPPTAPKLLRKGTSTCAATTGFSGVIAGDVAYNLKSGILRATWEGAGSGYPAPSGGDFSTSYTITSGTHGNNGGCAFNGNTNNYANDVAAIPLFDSFGNSTTTTWPGGSAAGYPAAVNTANVGTLQDVENAGVNALDNAAYNARADANANGIPFKVYTLGLGGVDGVLLSRVANDRSSNAFQGPPYIEGKYVNAASAAALTNAFQEIADDIMRISK